MTSVKQVSGGSDWRQREAGQGLSREAPALHVAALITWEEFFTELAEDSIRMQRAIYQ